MREKICNILLALVLVLSFGLVTAVPAMAGAPEVPVNLGTAGNFAILAKTAITTTGTTSIVGDIGISPADRTYITGFALTMDATNQFSTSSLVTGQVYAADYTDPTPAYMTTAIGDMDTAYVNAAGRTLPNATELGAGNIGGMTLAPGLYKWGTGVIIPTDVTLSGGANDVWIFQIAGDLDISSGKQVLLSGGAQAKNIFWQVGGPTGATLGTTSVFNGNILSDKQIIMNSGATLNGRALAKTQVTLIANTIVVPPAAVMTGVTATSSSSTANATATYSANFTSATALTVATTPDRIVITFPSGFNASGASVNATTTVTRSGVDPTLVSATATVVTLNVAANEPAGVQIIGLNGIVNTQTAGTAYVVSVKTQDGDNAYATLDGPATSAVFSITAAGLNALQMVQQPTTAAAGVAIAPPVTVRAVDALGNVIAGQSVAASLQVGTGTLSGTTTQVTNASGIATFNNLSINLVGTGKALRFTAAAKTVDSNAFTITAAAVATLTVPVQPTTTVAGIATANVTVRAADALGNVIVGQSIVATLSTGTGVLSGTTTQVTNASGIATFNDLSINLVGTDKVLRFTAAAITVNSSTFTITAAAVATLTVQVQPSAAAAGIAIAPPVQVKAVDAFGNIIAGQSVAASLQVGTGVLSGTTTQVTNASGIATFNNLSINLVGTDKKLRFTAAAITVDSNAFTITAVAVATLTVQVQPSAAEAGATITPSVTVKAVDAFGNIIAGQSVAASLQVGTGVLSGTATQITNASGIATFNDLSINLVGAGKKLRFTAAVITVDSSAFNIYDLTLTLNTNGWTLISTDDYILSSGNSTSGFEGSVTLAYKYGATGYLSATIADLTPVEAIYVKTTGAGRVGLSYSTAQAPGASTKDLVAGWNLVSSATYDDANIVLSPLRYVTVGTQQGVGLATLVSQGSYNLNTGNWYIDATDWGNLAGNTMNPFDGYWVYMNAAKSFGVIPN